MGHVVRFVGQDYGNFLLTEKLKFRRHVCSMEDFSSWVWIAFLSEKAIQMSSCTYLIRVFQAVTVQIIVLIITSSSRPSISGLCWHNPAIWGQGAGGPDFLYTELTKCPYLENLISKGFS